MADSGGPILWVNPDTGDEIQVGINSRGDWGIAAHAGYYRADIPQTLDFVDSVIELIEAGAFGQPVPLKFN